MFTVADFVVSATEVALSVAVKSVVGGAGGVYVVGAPLAVDFGETLPHCTTEQETAHVTPLSAESLLTVAVNCAVAPAWTLAVVAESETLMGGGGGGGLAEPPLLHPELLAAMPAEKSSPSKDPRLVRIMASLLFRLGTVSVRLRLAVASFPLDFCHTIRPDLENDRGAVTTLWYLTREIAPLRGQSQCLGNLLFMFPR